MMWGKNTQDQCLRSPPPGGGGEGELVQLQKRKECRIQPLCTMTRHVFLADDKMADNIYSLHKIGRIKIDVNRHFHGNMRHVFDGAKFVKSNTCVIISVTQRLNFTHLSGGPGSQFCVYKSSGKTHKIGMRV